MSVSATTDVATLATGFSRALRACGLDAPTSATIDFAEALTLLGTERPEHVYWAGRACFCRREEDAEPYTETFRAFFAASAPSIARGRLTTVPPVPKVAPPSVMADENDADNNEPDPIDDRVQPPLPVAYSANETLKKKDFARYSDAELAEAERLMASLRRRPPTRKGRRLRATHSSGRGALDVRRSVRDAMANGGEFTHLARRERGTRPRRVVLLLDVSGSMSGYSRAMLRFAHSTVSSQRNVEVFTLGTRCTRITRQLAWRDPDAALSRVASAAPDLEGGTRLGECLGEFNDSWGLAGLARGAIVVLISDGWDRGDPCVLAAQMARLAHVAHRVIWVNPLKSSPGYEPLVRGMAAALPYADEFLSGHSLEALDELAKVMAR